MRQAVIGLLAHVDAGKTTLAESLLYATGATRHMGRVDHGDSFLDYEEIERDRGITVFSKQATFTFGDTRFTLLDTPGHVDFSTEAERTLEVLDCAILVLAANEPIRGHTKTLWRLLRRYEVPTVVFVNKMDLSHKGEGELIDLLGECLGDSFYSYAHSDDSKVQEQLALYADEALDEFMTLGHLSRSTQRSLILKCLSVPVLFGSALKQDGILPLAEILDWLAPSNDGRNELGARVFKVSHDKSGERLCWIKVTGGSLGVKQSISFTHRAGGTSVEKINQLRLYNGTKYEVVKEAVTGQVCAATGLVDVQCGSVAGAEKVGEDPLLTPVLEYAVLCNDCDPHAVHEALLTLTDEDPQLCATWDEQAGASHVRLMGSIQLEVLSGRLREEFGFDVGFGVGTILYKETIDKTVVGIGHFEPLRHYAEVHMRIEPLPRGSGVEFGTICMEDDLDRNWQRLILTNAMERPHLGVLTGSPIEDVRITLIAGRAHPKHTEGGDFRQATYRAIRMGLMQAKSVLLEPVYSFELSVPTNKVGRALSDLERMYARYDAPSITGGTATISGSAPVSEIGEYALQVSSYTSGSGSLFLRNGGYEVCHNAEQVIDKRGYDPESDLANTPDSVFCSHGAGYTVKWHDVPSHAHVTFDPKRVRPWRAADSTFFASV